MSPMAKSSEPFEVLVADYPSSIEDYQRAQRAPKSELPQLSDDQKAVARGFKISEEEYARGVLAGIYGREKERSRGKCLGEEIQKIIDSIGEDGHVARVVFETDRLRWLVTIRTSKRLVNVAIPLELADDVLDSALRARVEELRVRVAEVLRAEAVSKP